MRIARFVGLFLLTERPALYFGTLPDTRVSPYCLGYIR